MVRMEKVKRNTRPAAVAGEVASKHELCVFFCEQHAAHPMVIVQSALAHHNRPFVLFMSRATALESKGQTSRKNPNGPLYSLHA